MGLLGINISFSVCTLRDGGCLSKSVYVCVFDGFESLRYVQFSSSFCINV